MIPRPLPSPAEFRARARRRREQQQPDEPEPMDWAESCRLPDLETLEAASGPQPLLPPRPERALDVRT